MSKENSQAREFAESLSALMDNESNELELRRLLKEMPDHPEISQTWDRYNLTRSLLHKEAVRPMSAAGTRAILDAIAAEAPHGGVKPAAVKRRGRHLVPDCSAPGNCRFGCAGGIRGLAVRC
jgi:negative regulator of sigma E activity